MPPTLYLIDGHALAYRMYFALTAGATTQRWQNSKGEPTAGTYGFGRELMRILEQERPEYIAVAFDTGKTFRDEIFPEYKATREKMPDDLRVQIQRIRTMVDAFHIPRLEMERFEADDVIGSAARLAAEQGLGVKIITGDRDLLQLVNERTAVYLAGDDQNYITVADVVRKLGVRPDQVVDYKAIVGDKSDNIPGVAGVGEKTAIALLEKYNTLDAIYANLEQVEKRWKTKLEQARDSAYLSRDLALIHTDVPVQLDLEKARVKEFDSTALETIFTELEFKTLLKALEKLTGKGTNGQIRKSANEQIRRSTNEQIGKSANEQEGKGANAQEGKQRGGKAGNGQMAMFTNQPQMIAAPVVTSTIEVTIVDTPEKLSALEKELSRASVISFDTETTSTEEMQADIVGISLAIREGQGYYIPIGHNAGQNLDLDQVLTALRPSLTDPKIGKIAHNAKYDFIVLARHGLRVTPLSFDTMLAEFLVDPASRHLGLKNLSAARLGEEMTHIEDLIGRGKKQISMADVAVESAAAYAAADAETTLRLLPLMQTALAEAKGTELLAEIEMPLVTVLADMEMTGVLLDVPFLQKMSAELLERMEQIEKQVFDSVGKAFNINSTQQLSDILFSRLGLEPPDRGRKTVSGHFSTSADILENLRGKHPVVDWVLEHRELSKIKSTYLDALPAAVDPQTGRVHTSYSQIGAVTGRLSSSNPNLQNIPIRTELGRRVRNGFIAAPGNVLLSIDYSQIELRIVAHMAQDEAMLAAFRAGQDIHTATAAAVQGVALEAVTKDMRRHAKAINFGLIYGMSAFGLTRTTDLTLAEAEDFVKSYFTQFPGIKKYLDGIRKQAAQDGYVETLLGRRRYFPALQKSLNVAVKNREEREAINAPIQGTAADIMKIAMLRIPSALQDAGLQTRMLLQVHDELVLEAPRKEVERAARLVQETMTAAYSMSIPLSTEARWGRSWGEMESVN